VDVGASAKEVSPFARGRATSKNKSVGVALAALVRARRSLS